MKVKLVSFAIVLICLGSVVSAGVFSVYRSEGRVLSPEAQAKIEAFLEPYDIQLPAFLTE